jgi:nucleotide-binding universal stress UspA family protein
VACLPEPPAYRSMAVSNYSELADLAREALEEQLNRAVRRLSARGVKADWVISKCVADNALLRELESQTYDLVMVAAQKHGAGYTAGRSTIQLMRQASCPVWVVRPGHVGVRPRVLVAVAGDGPKDLNLRLICTANTLAGHFGGELHILSAWNAYGEGMLRGHPLVSINADDVRRYVEDTRAECARSLNELFGRCGFQVDRRRAYVIKGDPRVVIPQFCYDNRIAILVMGTVARTGLIGAILGNTAEKIAESLPATMVSVRPLPAATAASEEVELNAAAQASTR